MTMRLTSVHPVSIARKESRARFDDKAQAIGLTLIPKEERVAHPDPYTSLSCDPLMVDFDGSGEIAGIELLRFPKDVLSMDLREYISKKHPEPAGLKFEDTNDLTSADVFSGDSRGFFVHIKGRIAGRFYQTNENIFFGITDDARIAEFIYLEPKSL